jgi:hypothetical protein
MLTPRAMTWGAGLLSGLLFILASSGKVSSLFIGYTPYVPIFWAGLSLGAAPALLASGIATALCVLVMGAGGLLMFLALIAAPACVFIVRLLMTDGKKWYPVGLAMSHLCVMFCFFVAALVLAVSQQEGGMAGMMPPATEADPEWLKMARTVIVDYDFLFFGSFIWLQLLLMYALAVLVNFWLTGKNQAIRPSLAIEPFIPGGWLLLMLLGAGLLSFVSNEVAVLVAKASFIVLLFPYMLMGIAAMHQTSHRWQNRRVWLTSIYLFLAVMPYILLGFIAFGLYEQGRYLSNRPR